MKKKICFAIASLFGVGFSPTASGTCGSFITLFAAVPLCYFLGQGGVLWAVLVSLFAGVWATKEVLKYTKHDPYFVVVDEFCGQMLTFWFVAPLLVDQWNTFAFVIYFVGFCLFRLFDISKPWIVGWADKKLLNAWGVMLDDVFAGLFAAISLYGLLLCWNGDFF